MLGASGGMFKIGRSGRMSSSPSEGYLPVIPGESGKGDLTMFGLIVGSYDIGFFVFFAFPPLIVSDS